MWHVQTRNASFTGRNDVLEKLHDQLASSSQAVVLPLALHGLGGVGKTQVALEYAHRYMADYDVVWWVPAEQRELINPSLADLARGSGSGSATTSPETAQSGTGGAAPGRALRPLAADLRQRRHARARSRSSFPAVPGT